MGASYYRGRVEMNWPEFFHMGGYAYYVWPAWGLTIVVLLWLFLSAKIANKRIRREIERQISREKQQSL